MELWKLRLLNQLMIAEADTNSGGEGGEKDGEPSTETGDGEGKATETEAPEAKFTQADIDRIVKERLERAEAKAQSKAQKAREEAEAKALEENQEFQKLAEQRAAKVSELEASSATLTERVETVTAENERYKGALDSILKAQREGIDDGVIALLDKLDPVDQLEWIASNPQASKVKGVPATPKATVNGQVDQQALQAEERRKVRQQF